ncbi:MAG: hypothetical protein HKN15_07490 [Xanthomonadales bacterium]|nr:hypothetical protein [Xanthomonadales bacterium]
MAPGTPIKEVFHFDKEGTLPRPGPIGRLVRGVLGVLIIKFVLDWLTLIDSSDYDQPFILLWILFSVALAPYVVNIGFGVNFGAIPRYVLIGAWGLAGLAGWALESRLDSELLWTVIEITQVYIYGHLGLSFALSAVLATPGCEMRAIPQLLGKLSGSGSKEHYCPGFIDAVDRWERERKKAADESQNKAQDLPARDWLATPGGKLLIYGVPFVLLQLAGNLGGFTLATAVPAACFIIIGLVCLANAARSRRFHCYFMGPWCLVAGTLTALYSARVIDLGPHSWDWLVNGGMLGALVIYMTAERIGGRYRA